MNIDTAAYWGPFEAEAASFDQVEGLIHQAFDKWVMEGHSFAWRGLRDANYPLHSTLYRHLIKTWRGATPPVEKDLAEAEHSLLVEFHRWGLHMGGYGRLSVMAQLALLQHYGAPTRLIDVTFNPWIGLWFAVEQKWMDGIPQPDKDVRLIAIDVTNRLMNEIDRYREWEDATKRPWPKAAGSRDDKDKLYKDWVTQILVWRPPHFHPRLAAQNGGFLLGGVPATGSVRWPKTTDTADGWWSIDEVRQVTSVPLRAHKLTVGAGRPPLSAVFTIRIKASAVAPIRERLRLLFGYQHSTIYPDYIGFASSYAERIFGPEASDATKATG